MPTQASPTVGVDAEIATGDALDRIAQTMGIRRALENEAELRARITERLEEHITTYERPLGVPWRGTSMSSEMLASVAQVAQATGVSMDEATRSFARLAEMGVMSRNAAGETYEPEQGIRVEPYGFVIAEVELGRSRFALIDDDWDGPSPKQKVEMEGMALWEAILTKDMGKTRMAMLDDDWGEAWDEAA